MGVSGNTGRAQSTGADAGPHCAKEKARLWEHHPPGALWAPGEAGKWAAGLESENSPSGVEPEGSVGKLRAQD